jgi:hypothetical protein
LARALYRSRQVWHALRPRLDSDRLQSAFTLLNEQESALFERMERRDQRHALEVMTRLRARGVEERNVLVAALLHDCGKGAIPLWLRVAKVLAPRLVTRVGREAGDGWRGAAHRLMHDSQLSAALAKGARASPVTVRLIAGHPAPGEEAILALLRAADDAS